MSKRKLIVIGVLVLVTIVYVLDKGHATGSGSTTQCQVQALTDVRVHSGPSLTSPVIGQLNKDSITAATATVQNGLRQLSSDKWATSDPTLLKPVTGNC
ncbi:MAG TPA: SH3 domain-containing protein [Pseudonocardiaceae bacterium]